MPVKLAKHVISSLNRQLPLNLNNKPSRLQKQAKTILAYFKNRPQAICCTYIVLTRSCVNILQPKTNLLEMIE